MSMLIYTIIFLNDIPLPSPSSYQVLPPRTPYPLLSLPPHLKPTSHHYAAFDIPRTSYPKHLRKILCLTLVCYLAKLFQVCKAGSANPELLLQSHRNSHSHPHFPLSLYLVRFIRTLELFDILSESFDYIPLWFVLRDANNVLGILRIKIWR